MKKFTSTNQENKKGLYDAEKILVKLKDMTLPVISELVMISSTEVLKLVHFQGISIQNLVGEPLMCLLKIKITFTRTFSCVISTIFRSVS